MDPSLLGVFALAQHHSIEPQAINFRDVARALASKWRDQESTVEALASELPRPRVAAPVRPAGEDQTRVHEEHVTAKFREFLQAFTQAERHGVPTWILEQNAAAYKNAVDQIMALRAADAAP